VAVDVGKVIDRIVAMLHCHVSQFYEWLPYNRGGADQVPSDDAGRQAWLGEQTRQRLARQANRFRDLLVARYGPQRGTAVQFAEAFEACEYGAPLDERARERLFSV
jgi:hypothetical protein